MRLGPETLGGFYDHGDPVTADLIESRRMASKNLGKRPTRKSEDRCIRSAWPKSGQEEMPLNVARATMSARAIKWMASILARSAVFVSIVVGAFSTPCHASVRQDSGCRSSSSPGQWSATAIDLSWLPHEPHRNFCAYSPDHAKVVHVVDDEWWIEANDKRISGKLAALMYFELQWSPDSQGFYTTQSEGFTIHYTIDVYHLKGEAAEHYSRNLNRIVISDFNQHHKCWNEAFQSGNDPNIAGLTWVNESRDLVVVAQVPAIGICGDKMRYFGGYLISLSTGRITNRFSPDELGKRWKQVLGQHLQSDLGLLAENAKDVLP